MSTQKKLPNGNKDVIFRRVNGRIIPIRKKTNDQATGAALVAAGAGVTVAGSEVAARMVQKSAAMRVKAKFDFNRVYRNFKRSRTGQMTFGFFKPKKEAMSGARGAVKTRAAAAQLFKARKIPLGLGAALGAALIGAGLDKFQKDQSTAEEVATNTVAGAVATGAGVFYYRRLGLRNVGLLKRFASAKKAGTPRPFNIPIKFKKGGPFNKGGTLRF
jgi:hypothetical protein